LREVLNENKAYAANRNLIVTPASEAYLLDIDDFIQADKRGDGGNALQEANLGRVLGFNTFMCQNASSVAAGNTTVAGAVNMSTGYAAGSTTLTVDTFSTELTNGSWCTVAGDMTPQLITAHVGNPTTQITITPGLKYAVVNDAAVTVYSPGAVNLLAGYAANWAKAITVDGFTVAPRTGQLTSFGTTYANRYSTLSTPTTTSILLDRPLTSALSNNDVVGIGPAGDYNFAFHRNAVALVSRPLAMPMTELARASVANYNGLSVRVVITYDGTKQGHLVTVDLLCGVATLDTNLGAVMFA
jgi:hypothetical protein